MNNDTYKNYVEDCLDILIDMAAEAKKKANRSNSSDFDKGRSIVYFETLSFLLGQAKVFGILGELKEKIRGHEPMI